MFQLYIIVIHAARFQNLFRCSCHGVRRCVASNQSEALPIFGEASFEICNSSTVPVQTIGLRSHMEKSSCIMKYC